MTGTRPLDDVRVLDLTHVLAGPYATGQLALMGAEVIRVERPAGDDFVRRHGGTEEMRQAGLGASFLSQNAGKRSLAVDLKTEEGRRIVLDLAARADVVTENFRPGVADRLGVGFDAVREVNRGVVYASLTGFGRDGALSGRPAYDHVLQGMSGLMAMTGTAASGPMRVGIPIVDYVAGQALVAAVLGALRQRDRGQAAAQRVEVSMLAAIGSMMGAYGVAWQATGRQRGLDGNRAFSDSPYSGRFETRTEPIVVTANTPAQASRLCAALDRADLAEERDPDAVSDALRDIFAGASAAHWVEVLSGAEVPAGPVLSLGAVLDDPEIAPLLGWRDLHVPQLDATFRVPGLAFDAPWSRERLDPAPAFGADTDAILSDLGRDAETIAALKARAIVHDSFHRSTCR